MITLGKIFFHFLSKKENYIFIKWDIIFYDNTRNMIFQHVCVEKSSFQNTLKETELLVQCDKKQVILQMSLLKIFVRTQNILNQKKITNTKFWRNETRILSLLKCKFQMPTVNWYDFCYGMVKNLVIFLDIFII